MNRDGLEAWRKHMGFSKAEAARQLTVADSKYRNLERGYRHDGYPAEIPNGIGLACCAVALGLKPIKGSLKTWRETLELSQKEVAEILEVSFNSYRNYERGRRTENENVPIPGYIRLACATLSKGIKNYDGPDKR